MSEQLHDYWSNLSNLERLALRGHERAADKKKAMIAVLKKTGGSRKLIAKLTMEAAGHRHMRQQYQNRGTQRAKSGRKPKLTFRDKRIRRRSFAEAQVRQ